MDTVWFSSYVSYIQNTSIIIGYDMSKPALLTLNDSKSFLNKVSGLEYIQMIIFHIYPNLLLGNDNWAI
jgi:hypothetical protein